MKKQILLSFLVYAATCHQAIAQEKLSLEKCVSYALEHNLNIKQSRFNEALSDQDLRQSKYNLIPSLNGQASQNFNKGRSINPQTNIYVDQNLNSNNFFIGSEVVLFSGLQKLNTIKQNKYSLMAQQNNVEKTKQDVTLNVVSEFLNALFYQDQVQNYQNQLKVSQSQVVMAKKKADVGTITEADYLQFKAQSSADELNLITAQNQLTISFLNLRQLLNIEQDKAFDIERPGELSLMNIRTDYSDVEVYNEALKINPGIKSLEYERLATEKLLEVVKGKYYPTLSLGASYSTNYSNIAQKLSRTPGPDAVTNFYIKDPSGNIPVYGPTENITTAPISFGEQFTNNVGRAIGLTLRIPFFNGLQVRTGVNKTKINLENAVVTEELAKNQLNKTIAQAVADLNAAKKKHEAAESSYASLKKAYDYSQKRFDVGLLNSLDLNIAKTNYSKAESDALQAKYDMILKSKVIDYYLGKPLTF
ncbi:TolC family protein [Solitalea koreensis]|uniref:Outer membrane protein n=1 Tax=Solitalea koreensis TaxID=543615 RepID=A0A521DJ91_9SPHI|nr:TolC family protein [Solitalea koreensis]SMO71171.1 outer membrane protein [Solitalea koreensis]